jgi:hypothetical protein
VADAVELDVRLDNTRPVEVSDLGNALHALGRTGDPDLGDWGPPEVLVRTGVIPDEFEAGGGVE